MHGRIKKLRNFGFETDNRTYVIAEIGLNHGGDVSVAKKLILAAAGAGADAVKFQTYITEKRAPKGNKTIYDLLQKCELPFEAFGELKEYAEQNKIDFLTTAFDEESVTFLESIQCAKYKVASFDVVNHKLLAAVAATQKPVILSVGMADVEEINSAFSILQKGTEQLALLHCVSAYPTEENSANLAAIFSLQEKFNCVIGYSDHTANIQVPLYAVAAGAQLVENHFKLSEDMECVDASVSITAAQMHMMVSEMRRIESMFGDGVLGMSAVQEGSTIFRRYTA